jgi:hypothetical protein
MLIDGAQLLEGSTLEISPIDFGTEFPVSADDGKRFKKEGTDAGNYVYSLFLNKWIKVDNVSFNSYDISASIFDRPRSNDVVVRHIAARTFYLKKDLEGSLASANLAATDLTVFDVFVKNENSNTKVATLKFLAGSSIGVFESLDTQNSIILGRGYELIIVAPENRDATLSSIAITLSGYLFV